MTCCFIGHKKINITEELTKRLEETVCDLINKGVRIFIFGDHSAFSDLCYNMITQLKEKYPYVKRVRFRPNYLFPVNYTKRFSDCGYEHSVCLGNAAFARKSASLKRSLAMIKESDICVFYYNDRYQPERTRKINRSLANLSPKSGTMLAYEYAKSQNKKIINLFEFENNLGS